MKNEVTVQEENIFAPVKRRPPYFLGAILAACILMMFCTPLPDQLILFPTTQRIDAHGALAAFDALKSKAGHPRIYVFGASIGSAVAMNVAANRGVRGLILHNPPPLRQIILRNYGWWNLWLLAGPVALQIPRELDSVA